VKRDEDEIEQSAAPLLEHLIELRRRLIWAILAFFVACKASLQYARRALPVGYRLGWYGSLEG
jgi:sec-independent protein translocase protein TatC